MMKKKFEKLQKGLSKKLRRRKAENDKRPTAYGGMKMDVEKMKARKDIEELIKALKDEDWHIVNQFFCDFT